jgi:type I restriction enzyme S subunit
MREGWRAVPLGTLIEKRRDFTLVEKDKTYRCAGVQRSGWGLLERGPFDGSTTTFSKLMRLEKDDLVYRTITAFEAPSAVVDINHAGLFVSPQTFPVFRIDRTVLIPDYMKLLTTSPVFHEAMATRCTGSVLRRMTLAVGAFESIPVSLPPLTEQRRIVDLIGAVDEAIDEADAAADSANFAFRSRLRRETTCGAKFLPLTDVSENLDNMRIPVSAKERAQRTGLVPYYGAAGQAGWIDEALWNEPLVCLGEDGNGLLNWQTVPIAYEINGPSWVNNHAHVLRAVGVSVEWLTLTLMHYDIAPLLNDGTRPKLNKGILDQILVRVDSEIGVATITLLALKESSAAAANYATELRSLRTELLAVLLSGKHEIPESYDRFVEGTAA